MPIIPRHPNTYTGSPLDRVGLRRDDAAWVATAMTAPETRWAAVWRGRNLFRDGQAFWLDAPPAGEWSLLGLRDGAPVFAVDLGDTDSPPTPPGGAFADLRPLAGSLPAADAAILAHARGLMHWRRTHRFCGRCGTTLEPRSAGNALACGGCGAQHFPRTDPAVIMLVTRGERALLAHSERFPSPTMYSTLAGFVEPGESLEEAVAREVFEEAGVSVGRVAYHSSQPWPFPASLMVGFYAEATSEALTLDPAELTDARWFTRAEIADPEAHGFSVPHSDSIARRLIEDWIT